MKFMLIMRADDSGVEAYQDIPFEQIIEAMGKYNESMMKAVCAAGRRRTHRRRGGLRRRLLSGGFTLVTDGPYGETKELFNGFWIIEVSAREEAVEWAKRAPLGAGAFLEVRRVTEMEDFPADNEWIQKEEGWREEQAERAQK